ncbi:MAG TPA: GGDEF domain-containing protein [Candidatus Competibacter sp.]|nr:GGDEF domain-containing protein [Candidatus Competibacter sp.]
MNELDPEKLLESVARLTEKRNRLSLEICLTQTMFELLAVEEIALYRFEIDQANLLVRIDRKGCWIQDDEIDDPDAAIPVIRDTGFIACAHGREVVMESVSQGNRYTFPIPRQDRLIGFLRLLSVRDLRDDRRLIEGFVQIYWNYLKLIEDNERDKLTGLLNRKTFDDKLMSILQTSRRASLARSEQGQPERRQNDGGSCYWLAVLDIDHFKRINDTYGHLYGDEVLILMANIMQRSFRRTDLLFRYGGEEFVVVLKTSATEDAPSVFERFRQNMERYNFPQVGQVTVSVGFTQIQDSEIVAVVITRADRALYYAKEHGRNQIRCYETLIAAGELTAPEKRFGDIELF